MVNENSLRQNVWRYPRSIEFFSRLVKNPNFCQYPKKFFPSFPFFVSILARKLSSFFPVSIGESFPSSRQELWNKLSQTHLVECSFRNQKGAADKSAFWRFRPIFQRILFALWNTSLHLHIPLWKCAPTWWADPTRPLCSTPTTPACSWTSLCEDSQIWPQEIR